MEASTLALGVELRKKAHRLRAEKINIGWPDPGIVHGQFAASIAQQAADMTYFDCLGGIHRISTSLLNISRNAIVAAFLSTDSEWLWFVDSDMAFEKGHAMRLWLTAQDTGAKCVGGLYFLLDEAHGQPVPHLYKIKNGKMHRFGLLPTVDEPIEVDAMGLGSALIHRDVFEALVMDPPRHEDYAWFDNITGPNFNTISGEDVQFFWRAKQAGFKCVVDPRAGTTHIKSLYLDLDSYRTFWAMPGNSEHFERLSAVWQESTTEESTS